MMVHWWIFLMVQGTAFSIWALLVFRWLFVLYADAVMQAGTVLPGIRIGLRVFRSALQGPRYRRYRNATGALTLLLLGVSALFAIAAN